MDSSRINREWIILQGDILYQQVMIYKDRVKHFIVNKLGASWEKEQKFAPEYFAEKMKQAREDKRLRLERLRNLIPPRGNYEEVLPECTKNVSSFIDEIININGLIFPSDLASLKNYFKKSDYDFDLFKTKLIGMLHKEDQELRELPAILDNPKIDLIFKFITLIHLAHSGLIRIKQPGPNLIFISKWCLVNHQPLATNTTSKEVISITG